MVLRRDGRVLERLTADWIRDVLIPDIFIISG